MSMTRKQVNALIGEVGDFRPSAIQPRPCTEWPSLVSPPQCVFLTGQSLRSDQEKRDVLEDWLKGLAFTFFEEGTQKLVPGCDKCLNLLKPSGNFTYHQV
jgi:hypothetical protein